MYSLLCSFRAAAAAVIALSHPRKVNAELRRAPHKQQHVRLLYCRTERKARTMWLWCTTYTLHAYLLSAAAVFECRCQCLLPGTTYTRSDTGAVPVLGHENSRGRRRRQQFLGDLRFAPPSLDGNSHYCCFAWCRSYWRRRRRCPPNANTARVDVGEPELARAGWGRWWWWRWRWGRRAEAGGAAAVAQAGRGLVAGGDGVVS